MNNSVSHENDIDHSLFVCSEWNIITLKQILIARFYIMHASTILFCYCCSLFIYSFEIYIFIFHCFFSQIEPNIQMCKHMNNLNAEQKISMQYLVFSGQYLLLAYMRQYITIYLCLHPVRNLSPLFFYSLNMPVGWADIIWTHYTNYTNDSTVWKCVQLWWYDHIGQWACEQRLLNVYMCVLYALLFLLICITVTQAINVKLE